VNLASKVPTAESFATGSASYGTASNGRITGDVNHAFEGTGRGISASTSWARTARSTAATSSSASGWAFAPSLAFGLEGDTRSYFYLLHTEQDNTPDGGVTTLGLDGLLQPGVRHGRPERGRGSRAVDSSNYYGFTTDFEEVKGTMFTARFEHDFNDNVTDPQHLALRQAAPVLRAHGRERSSP
jgi:catecholate siderophore receptor